jgi:hypothetical protein
MATRRKRHVIGCGSLAGLLLLLSLESLVAAQLRQQETADQLGALVEGYNVRVDDAGNVIALALSNHGVHKKAANAAPAPGVRDGDLKKLLELPKLQMLFLEHQPLTNAGYQVLAQLPELTDLRLHYINSKLFRERAGYAYPLADAEAALVVNSLRRPLTVLELKHCFAVKDVSIDRFAPQPELIKLELDTTFAGPEAVEFILSARKVRNLQLHRTTMSDADLVRVLQGLPDLEILELRPVGPKTRTKEPITAKTLRGLARHRHLRAIFLGIRWPGTAYENGLQHLATLPTLEVVDLHNAEPAVPRDHAAVKRLHRTRPDLTIVASDGVLEGTHELKEFPRDEDYRWGVAR